MQSTARLAVTMSSLLALTAIVACSAAPAPAPSDDSEPAAKKTTKPDTSSDTNPTTPTPTADAATPTADACGTKTTFDACFDCCYAKNPTEYDKSEVVYQDCICVAPGACKADCADTFCGSDPSKMPSAACETCLSTTGKACDDKAGTACSASAGCKEVDDCIASQCAALDK